MNLTGWQFTDGISYKFASNKIMAAGAYLLVTEDAASLRALYPTLEIVGNFGGSLSHARRASCAERRDRKSSG